MNPSKRLLTILLIVCLLVAAALAGLFLARYLHAQRIEGAHNAGADLQWAIEHWSVNQPECINWSQYPKSIDQLQSSDYPHVSVPTNFLTGMPMKELHAGDENSLGDFRYIPCQMQYQLNDGSTYVEHYLYTIVVYVSKQRDPHPLFNGRLGSTEIVKLENGLDRRAFAQHSPEIQALIDQVVSEHEETYDEALTRLGYK